MFYRNHRLAARVLFAAGASCTVPAAFSQALTTANVDTRTNLHVLTFRDLTFANAFDSASNTLTLGTGIYNGQTGGFTSSFQTGVQSFGVVSGSGVQLGNVVSPSSSNSYTASLNATVVNVSDPTQDWFAFDFGYPAATAAQGFTYSRIVATTTAGYDTLEFQCCGTNLVRSGGTYVADLNLPGDWSNMGSGVGQARLLGALATGWGITKNFVYDSLSSTTTFEVTNTSYVPGSTPGIDVLLTGLPAGTAPPSTPMVQNLYALREQITANDAGLNGGAAGDLIQMGAYCITFGAGCTTTSTLDTGMQVTAENGTTLVPLAFARDAVDPDHWDATTPFTAGLSGPWTLQMFAASSCQPNCSSYPVNYATTQYPVGLATTPGIVGAQPVDLPANVTIAPSSNPALPQFTWTEPASFYQQYGNAAAVRIQIWDLTGGPNQTPLQIYVNTSSTPTVSFARGQSQYTFSVPASFTTNQVNYQLVNGHQYALEIQNLVLRNSNSSSTGNPNVLSRARAFFDFFPGSLATLPPGVTNYYLPTVTPATATANPNGAPVYTFNISGVGAQTSFVDPPTAIGYTFTAGPGDPNFASVTVPAINGSNYYLANVTGSGADLDSGHTLGGGVQYNFQTQGGVRSFQVLGINPSAALDPTNSSAFVTGLSFVSTGNFTGTMVPVIQPAPTASASTVSPGGSATLSVTASGTGPFTYQWYQGVSGDVTAPISGATGSSYSTPALSSTTNYWVRVGSPGGVFENSSTITITVAAANTGSGNTGDGPLPLWVLLLLGGGLYKVASRRLNGGQS